MADHFAQQIIDAVVTAVTGLTTTGSNVRRGDTWPFGDDQSNALTVKQGVSDPIDAQNWENYTVRLEIIITTHAKTTAEQADSELTQMAKEVFIALMADRTLGLPFVMDCDWTGNDEPDTDVSGELITARQDNRFAVTFRHSITDPSQ